MKLILLHISLKSDLTLLSFLEKSKFYEWKFFKNRSDILLWPEIKKNSLYIFDENYFGDYQSFLNQNLDQTHISLTYNLIKKKGDQNYKNWSVSECDLSLQEIKARDIHKFADTFVATGVSFVMSKDLQKWNDSHFTDFFAYFTPRQHGGQKALFLDRDGIINVDSHYISQWSEVEFVPGIFDLIKFANTNDYKVIVLTNQSGIARGFFDVKSVDEIHKKMNEEIVNQKGRIDQWYFCPYHEDVDGEYGLKSYFRKPYPAMALLAADDWNLDFSQSIMLGDKISDQLLGLEIDTYFIQGKYSLKNKSEKIVFQSLEKFNNYLRRELVR